MKFSVIIPVYNVAPFLRDCLGSVLSQTFFDGEIICVDDGSSDGSADILDEIGRCDARVHVVHQTNGGVSSARNRGLMESKGEWILFLDGDDMWHPETLKVCAEMIAADQGTDLVHFTRFRFAEDETPQWGNVDRTFQTHDLKNGVLGEDLAYSFSTFCYRRDIAISVRFPKYIVGEDLIYRSRCLQKARRIVSTTSAFLAYRMRIGSVTNSHFSWRKYVDRVVFTGHWIGLVMASPYKYPNRFWWRLVKNLVRGILNLG